MQVGENKFLAYTQLNQNFLFHFKVIRNNFWLVNFFELFFE